MRIAAFFGLIIAVAVSTPASHAGAAEHEPIDFNRDVRPILIQYCTSCHGGVKQAGDVSFVYADRVLPPDGWIVEPGEPDESILIQRITTDDADMRMPPADEHPEPLPAEDVETLRRWISEGAKWGDLWSMAPLKLDAPAVPGDSPSAVAESSWAKKKLDLFVETKRTQQGLSPSPPAPPNQWLRRVSLDLTGLPPTPAQIGAFESACKSAANEAARDQIYAAEVDRLLASPQYGQRWASMWMDLARYADSMGFEKDPHRDMWPYRDWLIRSFNRDMPYDEFTIKQLAGDLLPDPTADDLIATAFHRNTQTNTEGGTDDEEFRVAAIIDRVNTTWTVWQATTFGCVQCHSHPYDPLEHDEYYRCMALFDSSLDADLPDDYPTFKVPTNPDDIEHAFTVQREYESARQRRNDFGRQRCGDTPWTPATPTNATSSGGKLKINDDHVQTASGTFPVGVEYTIDLAGPTSPDENAESAIDGDTITGIRLEIFPDPGNAPGQGSLLTHLRVAVVDNQGDQEKSTDIAIADVFVDALTQSTDPRDSLQGNSGGVGEHPKLNDRRWACFIFKEPVKLADHQNLRLRMKQSQSTTGNLATPIRDFRWSVTDDPALTELLANPQLSEFTSALDQAKKQADEISGASLPIVRSRPSQAARVTRTFIRGNWMERDDAVTPGIPAVFTQSAPLIDDAKAPNQQAAAVVENRLDFANWLVSKGNPLAARVWANRIWAQLFGRGLVETEEDFGSSGLAPSDPMLLDHLADLARNEHRWHLKPLLRDIVLSSTYRQTHDASDQNMAVDPRNRYFARGPRTRLSAEMIRDQALAASQLLSDESGGPSVMPPQPDGVWQAVYSGAQWKTSEGDQRYRRALYTYWRRTSPYPSFLTFDSPTRDLCSARRLDTNTPLQALVTLNDPVYQECSAALAKNAIDQSGESVEVAIDSMFRSVTSQTPNDLERSALLSLYTDLRSPPTSSSDDGADNNDDIDLPTLSIVANTILNLDKALTK
ncbi:Planctomycete cytochrome C [Rubripirellula lacrimiformis]|uniref:Planctomycete cytochrome C n=1 Tax=Rubripirellula lacrimiformis TaxID=1930273 RepID=A0A517N6Z3_9BACT|nr:PSD1 and planctomycete cytochrome C domain-containing protein [Rubripirellula lacrimiformis]QDT02919.1 Planctomycete cytochrome C [Rubripirellula lacrimiformis]